MVPGRQRRLFVFNALRYCYGLPLKAPRTSLCYCEKGIPSCRFFEKANRSPDYRPTILRQTKFVSAKEYEDSPKTYVSSQTPNSANLMPNFDTSSRCPSIF